MFLFFKKKTNNFGNSFHKMPKPILKEKQEKTISKYPLLKFLPSLPRVKRHITVFVLKCYNMGQAVWKSVFGHMRTVKAQISLLIHAAWSGPNRIIGYYRMFEWRAKAQMILWTGAGWAESVHFLHGQGIFSLDTTHIVCWKCWILTTVSCQSILYIKRLLLTLKIGSTLLLTCTGQGHRNQNGQKNLCMYNAPHGSEKIGTVLLDI